MDVGMVIKDSLVLWNETLCCLGYILENSQNKRKKKKTCFSLVYLRIASLRTLENDTHF